MSEYMQTNPDKGTICTQYGMGDRFPGHFTAHKFRGNGAVLRRPGQRPPPTYVLSMILFLAYTVAANGVASLVIDRFIGRRFAQPTQLLQ
jgi:hypothetical protein